MKTLRNEQGFVLVTGLLTLVVLTFLGLAATTNTTIELKIAGNDRVHHENFYDAEATVILGTELLEQNFNCATGFEKNITAVGKDYGAASYYTNANSPPIPVAGTPPVPNVCPDAPEPHLKGYSLVKNKIRSYNQGNDFAYWRNPSPQEWDDINNEVILNRDVSCPAAADAAYPAENIDSGVDVGFLYIGGFSEMLPGGALQMASGYEGKGKGSASGGVAKIIDIYSTYYGELNSQTCVVLGWRHLIGSEGDCIF